MEPKNYEGIYIVDAEWLANHRKEHYDIEGDEVTFSTLPYVTFEDIYEDAEHINIPLDRLRELCAAERDGRCVVLPCKVGDTLYKLWYEPCHNGEDRPDGMGCAGCIDECDIKRAVVPFTANSVEHIVGMRNSLNRFWFLTRAEAEAALAQEG